MIERTIRIGIPVRHVRAGWPGVWDALVAAVRRRPQVGTTEPMDLQLQMRFRSWADAAEIVDAKMVPRG
jgi:hypothetical protein